MTEALATEEDLLNSYIDFCGANPQSAGAHRLRELVQQVAERIAKEDFALPAPSVVDRVALTIAGLNLHDVQGRLSNAESTEDQARRILHERDIAAYAAGRWLVHIDASEGENRPTARIHEIRLRPLMDAVFPSRLVVTETEIETDH